MSTGGTDRRISVLFLIESLSGGGAERVLSTLVEHLDHERYMITVCPIVNIGSYVDEVKSHVSCYSPVIKNPYTFFGKVLYKLVYYILPPRLVYKLFVPKGNDIEVAFCEGYATKLLSYAK